MIGTTKITTLISCCLVLAGGTFVEAGTLNGHAAAYDDNLGPQGDGSWSGTAPYANNGLNGTVDWAVFTGGVFNTEFPGAGYVALPGTLVYAYQLLGGLVNNPHGATQMSMLLDGHPAFLDGKFNGGGVTGNEVTSTYVDPTFAFFTFDATSTGQTTEGMAYSSTNRPQLTGIATILNSGTTSDTTAFVAIPGPNLIPELSTGLMACLAMGWIAWRRRKR